MHKRLLMIAMAAVLFASGVFGFLNVISPGVTVGNPVDAKILSEQP